MIKVFFKKRIVSNVFYKNLNLKMNLFLIYLFSFLNIKNDLLYYIMYLFYKSITLL